MTDATAFIISTAGYYIADLCLHYSNDISENMPVEGAEICFLIFNEFIKRVQDL